MKKQILKPLIFLLLTPVLALAASEVPPAGEIQSLKGLPKIDRMDAAAVKGVQYFQEMEGRGAAKNLGVGAAEAPVLGLGYPILHYYIPLDSLRAFHAGQDPASLLSDKYYEVSYPLQNGTAVRSAVTLAWKNGDWKVAAIGNASWMQRWHAFRAEQSQKLNRGLGDFFTVRVYALGVEFLGYYDSTSKMMLIPESDRSDLGFQKGETLPADQALLRLVPAALEHNDRLAY